MGYFDLILMVGVGMTLVATSFDIKERSLGKGSRRRIGYMGLAIAIICITGMIIKFILGI
jgi:hypothetical protein